MTPNPWSALKLSIEVGAWCAVLGLVPAVALGWVLARRRFPGRSLVSAFVFAPMVLPPVVTGFLLLRFFGAASPLGKGLALFGISAPFTLAGAVLAALAVSLPLYVMALRGAFEAVDPRLEEVSWTLGAPPSRTFRRVTLPLALPGLAAGAVLAFARALGEFGATAVVAGNVEGRTRTLALAVYTLLDAPGGEPALRVLLGASLALSFGSLLGYEALVRAERRRLELDGR